MTEPAAQPQNPARKKSKRKKSKAASGPAAAPAESGDVKSGSEAVSSDVASVSTVEDRLPDQETRPEAVVSEPFPTDENATTQDVADPQPSEAVVEAREPEPTLEAFFGPEPVRIATFLKVLKSSEKRRFTGGDVLAGEELQKKHDVDGSRLWLLATNATQHPAIEAWVWSFVRSRLAEILGSETDLVERSPTGILRQLIKVLAPKMESSERTIEKAAETYLRLGISWLIERRNLELLAAGEVLRPLFVTKPRLAVKSIKRAMSRGTRTELQTSVIALSLADDRVQTANEAQENERRQKVELRERLDFAEVRNGNLQQTIARLEAEKEELLRTIAEEQQKADNANRHAGHDLSQTKADFGVKAQRIRDLVGDAASAVSIGMKRADPGSRQGYEAADKRLTAAKNAIEDLLR